MEIQEYQRGDYTVSTDQSRLNLPLIHQFLSTQTEWGRNRTLEVVTRAAENSLNFGVFQGAEQVGYARVVTDYATFAWICDVFILNDHRAKGLGKWLVACITNHPQLKLLRRLLLSTRNAHGLYRTYGGFSTLSHTERWMEKFNPGA